MYFYRVLDKCNNCISKRNSTITVTEIIESIETKVNFKAFGKTKPPSKAKFVRGLEIKSTSARGLEAEEYKARKIYATQMKEIEDDINKLKFEKHGTVTNVFKMAEKIGGAKKQRE